MKDKWRNKDIVFYSFIILWVIIILSTDDRFQGSPYWFIGSALILLILRLSILRNWWDREVKWRKNGK
jgi:hypothetical protein